MSSYKILLILIFSMLLGNSVVVLAADFGKGWEAYESGDYETALAEWTPLAEQGHVWSQVLLGFMYDNGEGVPENDKTAVMWYTKAAEQGDASAQNNLGVMYDNGEGVLTDYVRAYMWYNLGAYNGNKLGTENKTKLAKTMTSSQIAKAQEMSSRCLESGYTDC